MNETYLATLLNTLLEKSAYPRKLLDERMQSKHKEFETQNALLVAKLKAAEAEVEALRDEAYKQLKVFDENFIDTFTNRKRTLRDAHATLEHFFNKNQKEKGTFHLAKSMSKWKVKVNVKKVMNQEELSQQAEFSDEFLARYGEVRVEPHVVVGQANFLDIKEMIDPWVDSFYNYLEMKAEFEDLEDEVVRPLIYQQKQLEANLNKAITAEIKAIIKKLKPKNSPEEIYNFEPQYHRFTGNQKPEDLEFPRSLSMDIYLLLTKAITYAGRIKTNGQKRQPDVLSALANVFPELIAQENARVSNIITNNWYDWKFDLFPIQESFISVLRLRAQNKALQTTSRDLNSLANQIYPAQAQLILSKVEKVCFAAQAA